MTESSRADERSERLTLGHNEGFLAGDACIARQHGFADTNEAVTVAHRRRHMSDFVASRLPLLGVAAKHLKGFVEKRFDVVRLQATSVSAFHVCTDALHFACVHGIVGQRPFVEQSLQVTAVESGIEHCAEERLDFWSLAVTDSLDQEFAQRFAFELEPAEHIEDLAAYTSGSCLNASCIFKRSSRPMPP